MSDKSGITWTDATWPIIVGCDRVSSGCLYCYAIRSVWRMAGHPNDKISRVYAGLVRRHANGQLDWTGEVRFVPQRLDWPLKWKKPRRIFVPSLGDIFHEDVGSNALDQIFAIMALCPQHTFQVLTKRPERMAEYLASPGRRELIAVDRRALADRFGVKRDGFGIPWPLPNVWVGTSVEDQRAADERIPYLLRCPAAVRFLSCEPLLGPIDLWGSRYPLPDGGLGSAFNWGRGVHWVIAGGESGPRHRPMDPAWARAIRDQCQAAGVAFHHKQNGGRTAREGGRLLDGRIWEEFPDTAGVGR